MNKKKSGKSKVVRPRQRPTVTELEHMIYELRHHLATTVRRSIEDRTELREIKARLAVQEHVARRVFSWPVSVSVEDDKPN